MDGMLKARAASRLSSGYVRSSLGGGGCMKCSLK
jgi:hypothetical protein